MFLLFFALLLTTTTLHIYKVELNLGFAIAADPCDGDDPHGEPTLTYELLDEFMDEATVVLPGGWGKMTCNSSQVHFIQKKDGPAIPGSQMDKSRTTLTVPVDHFSIRQYFQCKCNDTDIDPGESSLVWFNYIVCSREQYKDSSSECELKEVCLVKESDPGSCQNLIQGDCDMGVGINRTRGMEYTTVCLGNSTEKYKSECKAGANAGARSGWPMVETTGDCNNQDVDVTFNGTKAQCEWPEWTGLGTTNPETESKTCQQEFNFPYPVNPEARKLVVGYNTSITDIPTTTTQTTTTPTTTKTTEPTTTTTTTRIPDFTNITLNTTANISQQTAPRNKSWSTKEDVFILVVAQFLLFLLPSFMLYKKESLYIKE